MRFHHVVGVDYVFVMVDVGKELAAGTIVDFVVVVVVFVVAMIWFDHCIVVAEMTSREWTFHLVMGERITETKTEKMRTRKQQDEMEHLKGDFGRLGEIMMVVVVGNVEIVVVFGTAVAKEKVETGVVIEMKMTMRMLMMMRRMKKKMKMMMTMKMMPMMREQLMMSIVKQMKLFELQLSRMAPFSQYMEAVMDWLEAELSDRFHEESWKKCQVGHPGLLKEYHAMGELSLMMSLVGIQEIKMKRKIVIFALLWEFVVEWQIGVVAGGVVRLVDPVTDEDAVGIDEQG